MRKLLTIIAISIMAAGCGKGSKTDTTPPAPAPAKASLLFPAKDEVCNQGTVISATKNKVVFKWSSAANADSYSIVIKNLLTGVNDTETATKNQLEVTLDRTVPYSWYVVSQSSKNTTTVQSDTWKFYNSGPGVTTYAPFPAEAVSPLNGVTVAADPGLVYSASWKASDVDNDIVNYDFYLGTSATPLLFASGVTDTFVKGFPVKKGTTYYWRVVTRDAKGNTSYSDIFQFKVSL